MTVDGVLDLLNLDVELISDLARSLSGFLFQVSDLVIEDALHVGSNLLGVEPLVNDILVDASLDDGLSEYLASLFHGLLEICGLLPDLFELLGRNAFGMVRSQRN